MSDSRDKKYSARDAQSLAYLIERGGAASVAQMMGGGPVLGASASLFVTALDEFEKDFKGKAAANS